MLRLARMAIGMANNVAKVVPIAAIATVSAVRCTKSGSSVILGGQAWASQCSSCGSPVASRAGSMPARCQAPP